MGNSSDTRITIIDQSRIDPDQYPLTELDRTELEKKRGFTEDTVKHCRFGSIKNQSQLNEFGIEAKFNDLKSTILIPYLGTADEQGHLLFQLHKRHMQDSELPLYTLDRPGVDTVVITEGPFKAAAAWQLGYSAIALNGIWSHIKQLQALRDAVKRLEAKKVIIHLDTERTADGDTRDSGKLALAYAYALQSDEQLQVTIAELPEKYLKEENDSQGRKYQKADLDGALAAGLTDVEWNAQVALGRGFWDHPAGIILKTEAICLAERDNIFTCGAILKRLVEKQNPITKTAVVSTIGRKLVGLAFDPKNNKPDSLKLDAYEGELKKLIKQIDLTLSAKEVHNLLCPPNDGADKAHGPPTPRECGLVVRNNRLYKVGSASDSQPALSSNVVPTEILSGSMRYLIGPIQPLNVVKVQGRTEPLEVVGSLFDAAAWETAGRGTITIPGPTTFKQYLDHKIGVDGIQKHDTSIDRIMWVGTCRDKDERFYVCEGTQFPQESEECPYHDYRFPKGDSNEVLELITELYKSSAGTSPASNGTGNGEKTPEPAAEGDFTGLNAPMPPDCSASIWLLWHLGSLFKPALRNAYPHLAVVGHKESGKTTVAHEFARLFGLSIFSAADQFSTSYRTRKSFANTNLPIIIDEVQRLPRSWWPMFANVLNLAYNISFSTHGDRSKYFVLGAPAMMLGQEWPFEDVALNAKTIILNLNGACKNPGALAKLRQCAQAAPSRKWAEYVCEYANNHDMSALVEQKQAILVGDLEKCEYERTAEGGRTVWNYATLLATADVAKEFGLKLDYDSLQSRISEMLCTHLTGGGTGQGGARRTIGQQFLCDLVDELQSRSGRSGITFEVNKDELSFNLSIALRYLQSRGHHYDISTARSMADHLITIGATCDRRRINNVQTRCCIVPTDVLKRFELDLSGLCIEEEQSEGKPKL